MENAKIECKAANLKEKPHLQRLVLHWSIPYKNDYDNPYVRACVSVSTREVENEEMASEALEPHQYLKGLYVELYMEVKLPSWFSSITNLVRIDFDKCFNVKCLPPFHQLPFLKEMSIYDLANLEYIGGEGGTSLFFPLLLQV